MLQVIVHGRGLCNKIMTEQITRIEGRNQSISGTHEDHGGTQR